VPRLVEAELASSGQLDRRHQPEALVADRTAELDSLPRQRVDSRMDLVAHEIELVMATVVCGVCGQFCRREGEDEPAVSCINPWKLEHITEERADGVRIRGVDDRVGSGNHDARIDARVRVGRREETEASRAKKQNNVRSLDAHASRLLEDETNRRIVELLAADGRLTFSELARRVHLSTPAVISRVRRLEDNGVIRGYGATIDTAALGLPMTIIVFLTSTRAMEQRLQSALVEFSEVTACDLVSGDISFVLRASVESVEHMSELLERLGRYGEVVTSVVLESFDVSGLPRRASTV
jgi:Lrp/AsnC family leucine-responsive transcriptional regulator